MIMIMLLCIKCSTKRHVFSEFGVEALYDLYGAQTSTPLRGIGTLTACHHSTATFQTVGARFPTRVETVNAANERSAPCPALKKKVSTYFCPQCIYLFYFFLALVNEEMKCPTNGMN